MLSAHIMAQLTSPLSPYSTEEIMSALTNVKNKSIIANQHMEEVVNPADKPSEQSDVTQRLGKILLNRLAPDSLSPEAREAAYDLIEVTNQIAELTLIQANLVTSLRTEGTSWEKIGFYANMPYQRAIRMWDTEPKASRKAANLKETTEETLSEPS
jgi:hypothetical protein